MVDIRVGEEVEASRWSRGSPVVGKGFGTNSTYGMFDHYFVFLVYMARAYFVMFRGALPMKRRKA